MKTSRLEQQILILIARRDPGAHERKTLQVLLESPIDWDYLITTARQHALLPLLHKNANSDRIPGHVRSTLKRESVMNAQSVLYLAGKALEVQKLLNSHSIENAFFKGPLLSELAYGEVSLRQAGDIDLLIHREDFMQTKELLVSLGYQMHPQLTPAQQASHLAFHCEIQFVRDDWFTVVDLHWALAPKSFVFKLETEEVLTRLQRVSVAGADFETLATEDSIVYQAMHGAKHLWRRLEWISSLGETIRAADSIDWEAVMSRAQQARATRMLTLGLQLMKRVSNIDVPVRLNRDASLADAVMAQIFNLSGPAESTETNLYNLKIMDRKRDALVSALRAVFVPTFTDWHALNLPPSLHPLYYAYRPLRLSKTYCQKLISRGTA
jgi:hypothetical protein